MENNIDLNLTLDFDTYLLQFDSFKYIKDVLEQYNELHPNILNYREFNYESIYPIVSDFISVVSLKRKLDIDELYFISYIAYKLKGAKKSVETILDFIQCKYELSIKYENDERVLNLKLDYIEVLNPYLAERNLLRLCKDLLYFTKYKISIEKLSIIYEINGEINKSYYTASAYYVDSDKVITEEIKYDL